MHRLKTYPFIFLSLILGIISCNDDEADYSGAVKTIQSQIDEGDLLKEYILDEDNYILTFETKTVNIPASVVEKIVTDEDKWESILTFTNGNTYYIPTLGSSVESLITNLEVNPSGYNPLAAQAVMNLPVLGHIKLIVHSKEGAKTPDVEHLFSSIEKGQTIPILGLYANYTNQVTLIYTDKEGHERASSTIEVKTGSIKDIFLPQNLRVVTVDVSRMEPGMTLVNSPGQSDEDTSVPYMFDADGEIRWVLDWRNHPELKHIGFHCGLKRMQNGNYLAGDVNNGQIVEVDLLGNLVNRWETNDWGFAFHHEVSEASDGSILIAATKNDAKLADNSNVRILDHIAELNPHTGMITQLWDLTEVLDSARITFSVVPDGYESNTMAQSKSNWCHNNGVTGTADGSVLCSCRWQGLVKFSRSGKLKWVIAPHNVWGKAYEKYLLTPLDKNGEPITDPEVLNGTKVHPDFDWGWGVHCPVELPNGHVMCFDNGFSRFYNLESSAERYSRAVEYEVDEQRMTVRQVWEYGKERGSSCFSTQVSGVQYLEQTNNRLFCPGINNPLSNGYGGRVIEINAQTGEVVFEVEVQTSGSPAFHRANRISLYPENE